MRRRRIVTCVLAVGALLGTSLTQSVEAKPPPADPVFADGGELAGSTNGISFAPDGTLWIANVLGGTITQIDPDTGEILDRLTNADNVFFPDDVKVGPDYSIYWTEIGGGTVFKLPPPPYEGPGIPLLPFGGLNSANPLTLSDDGRLFAAGCYGAPPANNSFVEIDPNIGGAGIINTLFGPVEGCASNSMSWYDGSLYSPQPFLDEVWRVDPDTGDTETVTSGWPVPIGTAFDSAGNLYALAQGVGEVVRIDLDNPDTANNREVIAAIPVGWADNIDVSADDRIFISSASDSEIAEVMPDGTLRTVVPGQFELAMGVAVIGDTVYTANIGGLWGFNRNTREQTSVLRAAFGLTEFPAATSIVAWGDHLVLMSALTGQIILWDPITNEPVAEGGLFPPPTDAQPFDGDLIVTQADGNIVRMSDELAPLGDVANVPGAVGLAARGGDVFVSSLFSGEVLRIIDGGEVLDTPETVFDGLVGPEGIDVKGKTMYVVEGGSQTLTAIDMNTGERATVADELGLQGPHLISPFGWFNDVTATGNDIYVNADRANVIWEF